METVKEQTMGMEDAVFTYQENQFNGECLPCTATVFNRFIDSADVAFKISTRQAVAHAIANHQPLDEWTADPHFTAFRKRQKDAKFLTLTTEQQLLRWTESLKSSLPCFIYGVQRFGLMPKTDKDGQLILGTDGQPQTYRRRKLCNIERLSALFMFDADHSIIPPREIYERTLTPHFPWHIVLAHVTSSGEGLRLVAEARTVIGNIADNQIALARHLGLLGTIGTTGKPVVDDSCIDATRISYCPRRQDILYIDEQTLFNTKKQNQYGDTEIQ